MYLSDKAIDESGAAVPEFQQCRKDVRACLARTARTLTATNALLEQVRLREAETDRFLAEQGLTREQVLAFTVPEEMRAAVDAEMHRLGLDAMLGEGDGASQRAAGSGGGGSRGFAMLRREMRI